ncbi:MAG TPA: lysylphosphatidylglycerol synthase transmembrane domain-containing protein [Gaiellaceae bacterium]|nr:lysylphosphatidylglycerol synthase transmembrane domain-containing protein [Gaiellaceae bacterium]
MTGVGLPRSRAGRLAIVFVPTVLLLALAVWRSPGTGVLERAFRAVEWEWVAAAVLVNLFSIIVRSEAWRVVIAQAIPRPCPSRRAVFSAFCVGLLANAALPGRVGELARVAVISRHVRRRAGTWATIVGTIFAHRLFDVVVAIGLVLFTLYAAPIPQWAEPVLAVVVGVGVGLLLAGFLFARKDKRPLDEELGPLRRVLHMARHGLTVLRRPEPAMRALSLQLVAWGAQLLAVYLAMLAFRIDVTVAEAALVLVIMNLVTVFPFWPGNVGLLQAAVAAALLPYGVSYGHGFLFAIGLQAIEVSVGIGLGFVFLAREGFTFAMLKRMPEMTEVEIDEDERVERIA